MNEQNRVLAHYKAGENTAALWIINGIYVYINFRMHGHGELDILTCRPGSDWEELTSGMNMDFGRAADRMVQKMMNKPGQPTMAELAAAFDQPLTNEDEEINFQNYLQEKLFEPLWPDNKAETVNQVVSGPDYLKVVDSGEPTDDEGNEHDLPIAYLISEFTRDCLCYSSYKPLEEMVKRAIPFLDRRHVATWLDSISGTPEESQIKAEVLKDLTGMIETHQGSCSSEHYEWKWRDGIAEIEDENGTTHRFQVNITKI